MTLAARLLLAGVLFLGILQACGQVGVYRASRPRVSPPPRQASPSPSIAAPSPKVSEPQKPILTESIIAEQELGESSLARRTPMRRAPKGTLSIPPVRESLASPAKAMLEGDSIKETDLGENRLVTLEAKGGEGGSPSPSGDAISTQPEEPLLIAKITPQTSPQRAVSLRLTEEGRNLLENQEYEKGLSRLEKAIAIDSRNPYSYYYLARVHYLMTHYLQSLNFLEIAEPTFAEEPNWSARVFALQGKNYDALGFFGRADLSYVKALKMDPNNRVALEGITQMRMKSPLP